MTEQRVSYLRCVLCQKRGPEGHDGFEAARLAKAKGWKTVKWDTYGNESHVCPGCAGLRKPSELKAVLEGQTLEKNGTKSAPGVNRGPNR